MRAPCRGAHSRPACDCCPSDGGDGAPKGANPNGTCPARTRGASRRASGGDLTTPGLAFAPSAPLSRTDESRRYGDCVWNRPKGRQPAPGRTSSWVRAEPRRRPSDLASEPSPAGHRTSSHQRALRESAPQADEVEQHNRDSWDGDNSPQFRHSGASRNPEQHARAVMAPGPRLSPG